MRTSWKCLLITLAAFAAIDLPAPGARADGGRPLVFSALGPGAGHGAIGLGGRVFVPLSADLIIPVPLFELDYVHGLGSVVDYELRVDTLLFATMAETGFRVRLVGEESFSLALRGDVSTVLLVVGSSRGGGAAAVFGLTPGLLISTGERTQLTFGLDVPMFFGATISGFGSGTGFGYTLRPDLGVELPVGERTNLFLHLQVYLDTNDTVDALPALAIGAAW